MTWTKARWPESDGYYWFTDNGSAPEIVYFNDGLIFQHGHRGIPLVEFLETSERPRWSAPIPEPTDAR